MKISNSKKISIATLFAFVVVQMMPISALAKTGNKMNLENMNQSVSSNSGGFCSKLDSISQKMVNDGSGKKMKDLSMKSLDESKLIDLRSSADKKRLEHYQKLYEKYPSDAQHAAIDQYRSTISAAIDQRRQEIDAIRLNYVGDLNKLIDSHQRKVHDSEQSIIDAVQSAYTSAKTSCSKGIDDSDVKLSFKNSIKSARENFVSNKQQALMDKDGLEELKKNREASLQLALDNFKKTAEEARLKLLQTLGN
jgi:hypothetical protein